jgi:hypothetical protein
MAPPSHHSLPLLTAPYCSLLIVTTIVPLFPIVLPLLSVCQMLYSLHEIRTGAVAERDRRDGRQLRRCALGWGPPERRGVSARIQTPCSPPPRLRLPSDHPLRACGSTVLPHRVRVGRDDTQGGVGRGTVTARGQPHRILRKGPKCACVYCGARLQVQPAVALRPSARRGGAVPDSRSDLQTRAARAAQQR